MRLLDAQEYGEVVGLGDHGFFALFTMRWLSVVKAEPNKYPANAMKAVKAIAIIGRSKKEDA